MVYHMGCKAPLQTSAAWAASEAAGGGGTQEQGPAWHNGCDRDWRLIAACQ